MGKEQRTFKFEVKTIDEEKGIFEGYAIALSDAPDSYNDIMEPGAFKKTLKESGKRVKILWRRNDVLEPIGKPVEMREDDRGLLIKGKLSLGVQGAREILSLMKDGIITELTISYDAIRESFKKGVRHIKEIRLWDFIIIAKIPQTEDYSLEASEARIEAILNKITEAYYDRHP